MVNLKQYVLNQIPCTAAQNRLKFNGWFQTPSMDEAAEFLFFCADKKHLERVLEVFEQHDPLTVYSRLCLTYE